MFERAGNMFVELFFPETRRLQPHDRPRVAAHAFRMLGLTGYTGFALGTLLAIPSAIVAEELDGVLRFTYGMRVSPLLVFAMACICVQTSWALAVRRSVRQWLREELSRCGVPVCTACGYDLTGNVTGTCPECGQSACHRMSRSTPDGAKT